MRCFGFGVGSGFTPQIPGGVCGVCVWIRVLLPTPPFAAQVCCVWVCSRALEEVHSDTDLHIRSDTGWYKRVFEVPSVRVSTGVPYTHTSDPLCRTQIVWVEQNLRFLFTETLSKKTGYACYAPLS